MGVDSLRKDWIYYKEARLIAGDVTVDQILDDSFVAAALKDLGPYQRKP